MWENPPGTGTQDLIDTSWVEHSVNISSLADNQSQVKVRYELVSDAGVVFGGWTIDAFSLASASDAAAAQQPGEQQPWRPGRDPDLRRARTTR